jgi:hypothetical protein
MDTVTRSRYGARIGRPPGAMNYANRELKEFWENFFVSEVWRQSAQKRILDGDAPHLESYLLSMVYGKPRETVDLSLTVQAEDFSKLSMKDLEQRAAEIASQLAEANALAQALDLDDFDATTVASQPGCTLEQPQPEAPVPQVAATPEGSGVQGSGEQDESVSQLGGAPAAPPAGL